MVDDEGTGERPWSELQRGDGGAIAVLERPEENGPYPPPPPTPAARDVAEPAAATAATRLGGGGWPLLIALALAFATFAAAVWLDRDRSPAPGPWSIQALPEHGSRIRSTLERSPLWRPGSSGRWRHGATPRRRCSRIRFTLDRRRGVAGGDRFDPGTLVARLTVSRPHDGQLVASSEAAVDLGPFLPDPAAAVSEEDVRRIAVVAAEERILPQIEPWLRWRRCRR